MCFKEATCSDGVNTDGCSKCVKMDKIRCTECSASFTRTHLLECVADSTVL
jgi:hypothetical protein